jgi:magnesium chelatase family protein
MKTFRAIPATMAYKVEMLTNCDASLTRAEPDLVLNSLSRHRMVIQLIWRHTQGKLSGPLLDRIDLHIEVPAVSAQQLLGSPSGESTESIRARVVAARERAMQRQGHANQNLQGSAIDTHAALDATALKFIYNAAAKLGWSARSTHRALKVARTIADLDSAEAVQIAHVAEAVQYRRGLHAIA